MIAEPGRCQYCACTESEPCTLSTGETCAWFNRGRTVCTKDQCVAQHHIDQEHAAATGWSNYLAGESAKRKERMDRRRANRKKKRAA